MWDKHKPYTHSKSTYTKRLSFSNKLFFDVGNTLRINKRKSEKTIQNSNFQIEIL